MSRSESSAARLHAVLARHAETVKNVPGISGLRAWKLVFDVRKVDVVREVTLAVGVLGTVYRDTDALALLGDGAARNLVGLHGAEWSGPFLSALESSDTGSRRSAVAVESGALVALDTVASLLAAVSSRDAGPARADVRVLHDQLDSLRDAIISDSSIPLELRFLIVTRLQNVRDALNRLDLLGADAVRQSCDTLAGAISRELRSPPWRARFRSFLDAAYAALGAAADVVQIGQGVESSFTVIEKVTGQ